MIYVILVSTSTAYPEFGLWSILGRDSQIQGCSHSFISVTLASFLHCLSIGHPNILETDEYLEESFNRNLAVLLWTTSSLEMLCSVDGDHIGNNRSYH